jgi:hypothetical protein
MARRREYEADRAAAELTSAADLGGALVAIQVGARYYEGDLWPAIERRAGLEFEPPRGVHADFAHRLRTGPAGEAAARYLIASLSRTTDTADTHPSLVDRLTALGIAPPQPGPLPAPEVTAADDLLGPLAPRLLEDFDAQWREAVGPVWRDRHRQLAQARDRFTALNGAAAVRALTPPELRERAFLADQLEEAAAALPVLEAATAALPDDAELRYVLGRSLLVRGDGAGAPLIDAAIRQDPRLILAGCELLIGWYLARGDQAAAERYRAMAIAEQETRFKAVQERRGFDVREEALPHELPPEMVGALRLMLAQERDVAAAYVARKKVHYVTEEPYFVLAVDVRFPPLRFRGQKDIDALLDRLSRSVQLPGQAWIVAAHNGNDPVLKKLSKLEPSALVYRR